MFGNHRFVIALIAVTLFVGSFTQDVYAKRQSDREKYIAARSWASKGRFQEALSIMSYVVGRRNPRDEYVYFTALLEFKVGKRTDCIKRCDQILKNRRTRYRTQAMRLQRLAAKKTSRLLQKSSAAFAGAGLENHRIYATALENQKRFVDSGYNNVAGRVLAAKRRAISQPTRQLVKDPNAFEKFVGKMDIPATQMARVYPAQTGGAPAPAPAYGGQTFEQAPPAPAASQPAPTEQTQPADSSSFDDAFQWDAAFEAPDASTPPAPTQPAVAPPPTKAAPKPTPVALPVATQPPAAPAPTKTAAATADFGDFGDTPTIEKPDVKPAPTKTSVAAEHMKPIPVPTKKPVVKKPAPKKPAADDGGFDGADFSGFGDDDDAAAPKKPEPKKPTPKKPEPKKPEPKKPVVKKPAPKKPAADDGGFDGADFGDFEGDDDDDDAPAPKKPEPKKPTPKKPEPKKPEPKKPAASGDDDDDDDDFDAFDGF